MTRDVTEILTDAENLPTADRIELIERLLDGLEEPDRQLDADWVREAERRLDGYLRGETTARPIGDALAKHLKPADAKP